MKLTNKKIALIGAIISIVIISFVAYKITTAKAVRKTKPESKRFQVAQPVKKSKPVKKNKNKNRFKVSTEKKTNKKISLDFFQFPHSYGDDFEKWAADQLKLYFNCNITKKNNYTFLVALREYVQKHFAEDWNLKLKRIVEKALPDCISVISDFYKKMDDYDEWFKRNRNLLATMTQGEIKTAIWQKRKELFGKDSLSIWDIDSKELHFQDLIKVFFEATHISLEDKLAAFQSIWDEMRADGAPDLMVQISKYHVAFWEMDSVQSELRRMTPSKRAEQLAHIRSAMGYDETKIKEKARFDEYQDDQWEKGQLYMSKRDEIIKNYKGYDRQMRLRNLRERFFKSDANRIAAEEAANFFRFKKKRIYGRN